MHEAESLGVWIPLVNLEMGIEAQNLVPKLAVEAAHDADNNNQHGNTQRDAQNGNQSDNGNKSPFGPQVPES